MQLSFTFKYGVIKASPQQYSRYQKLVRTKRSLSSTTCLLNTLSCISSNNSAVCWISVPSVCSSRESHSPLQRRPITSLIALAASQLDFFRTAVQTSFEAAPDAAAEGQNARPMFLTHVPTTAPLILLSVYHLTLLSRFQPSIVCTGPASRLVYSRISTLAW